MQIFSEFLQKTKNSPVKGSRVIPLPEITIKMKLRRRIEDYMRKYATMEQMNKIANFLGISH